MTASVNNQIVVSIPMSLNSRRAIAAALLERYGTDYLFMGRIFRETASNTSCQIEIYPTSKNTLDTSKFQKIAKSHNSITAIEDTNCDRQVVCLISADLGYQSCLKIAKFTEVFLRIGGLGVNLESAEIAHAASTWLANYNSDDPFEIYSLYVGLVEGENNYYSCGMHNFGKADVSVDFIEDVGLAIYVMNVFNYYRLTESPILLDGHTFQPDIESPRYQIKLVEDREYERGSWQHNSFGRWHLTRR